MPKGKDKSLAKARAEKLASAIEILRLLGFGSRQRNNAAGYALLALLDLRPGQTWNESGSPLRGIAPIIEFIYKEYGVRYAPNTRETIRDEAVKHFAELGLIVRNPDDPTRPTNSGKTVYQIESQALGLIRRFETADWNTFLPGYVNSQATILHELERRRILTRVPVKLPSGETVTLSPGGQNPLIRKIIEEFCPRFIHGGIVVYVGDAEDKFLRLDAKYLKGLSVEIPTPSKMPDVVIHDPKRNWLLLIEAVASAGPVDGKRRKELKDLFRGCISGLVFVTAFLSRDIMRAFLTQISWESEVWVADDPDHLIHFNGERFLGPYPDAQASKI
jgi:hypothetical protein